MSSTSEIEIRNSKFEIPSKVLVMGMGTSGVACTRFLAGIGTHVTITDAKKEHELASSIESLGGISYTGRFGGHEKRDFLSHELIVISPGIVTGHPLIEEARRHGARVIGEIELASAFIHEPIIAVTGTNGKTTTTTLLGEIFGAAFETVFVGGNIGNPLINYVMSGKKADYVIAEISSFQLETIERFAPHIAILLNITEDHLDRYPAFSDYVAAKMAVFRNQTENDLAFVNTTIKNIDRIAARKHFFSTEKKLSEGAFLDHETLNVVIGEERFSYRRDLSPLVGIHNSENLLSALLTSHLCGIDQQIIETGIRGFKGLAHRVEFVRERAGIRFYNDSKATNVDATKRALESIPGKVVLIAGGKDKGGSYRYILDLKEKIRGLVLIGEAKGKIESELGAHMRTYPEDTLEKAVARASFLSENGDVVLFSPMCSSFDMFENYKVRGDAFKALVEAL
jgi:UDP-N-acetylmuramoylalanine--D-glutamate ligase